MAFTASTVIADRGDFVSSNDIHFINSQSRPRRLRKLQSENLYISFEIKIVFTIRFCLFYITWPLTCLHACNIKLNCELNFLDEFLYMYLKSFLNVKHVVSVKAPVWHQGRTRGGYSSDRHVVLLVHWFIYLLRTISVSGIILPVRIV